MRQIVLDTETTGLEPSQGHKIIEIGCVELVNRRITGNHFHQYINPQRAIDEGALAVHGLNAQFLADKPIFANVVDSLLEFIKDAELIIHNAAFDCGFINHELKLLKKGHGTLDNYCQVIDTLMLARKLHPGQKNSLDALCKRYNVDNSKRDLHGALLDANLLAQVYLSMTGGQSELFTDAAPASVTKIPEAKNIQMAAVSAPLKVLMATDEELAAHQTQLEFIAKRSNDNCVWKKMEEK